MPAAAALVAIVLLLLTADAAGARVTSGPCPDDQNWAEIDGVRYTPRNDTKDDPVVVPAGEEITVDYHGLTTAKIRDHHGQITIDLAGFGLVVGEWSSPNKPRPETEKSGTTTIRIPNVPGLYDVSGFHTGNGGTCKGFAMVRIEGNPLTTPAGAGSVAGTALAAGGLFAAAFARPGKGMA